jgi:hypothetical protein
MEVIDTLQAAADAAHALGGPDALISYLLQADVKQLLHPSVTSNKEEPTIRDDVCAHCLSPLTPHVSDGDWVCHTCGTCTFMDASVQVKHGGIVSWADTRYVRPCVPSRAYARRSRLMDVMNQMQNNKHASAPAPVVTEIQTLLRGVTDKRSITATHIRAIMKASGWGKYYKYVPQILFTINQETAQFLHPTMHVLVEARFARLQRPFEELVKSQFKRKNFLCYNYVIRQCLFLEGASLLLQETYSVSRDPTRLFRLDRMWKVMCDSLHWPFRPLSAKGIKAFPSHSVGH